MHLTSNVVIGGLFLVSFLLVLVLDPKGGFVCLERGSCAESKEESQTICCCRALSRCWQTRSPSGERTAGPQPPDEVPCGGAGIYGLEQREKLIGLAALISRIWAANLLLMLSEEL